MNFRYGYWKIKLALFSADRLCIEEEPSEFGSSSRGAMPARDAGVDGPDRAGPDGRPGLARGGGARGRGRRGARGRRAAPPRARPGLRRPGPCRDFSPKIVRGILLER